MLPPYRIHDLRHFSASEALSLNIPDKYQMKRMGHSTDHMLRTVYQHVMRDKEDYFSDVLDQRMGSLYLSAHADAHKKESNCNISILRPMRKFSIPVTGTTLQLPIDTNCPEPLGFRAFRFALKH